jgi:hypothetical protein
MSLLLALQPGRPGHRLRPARPLHRHVLPDIIARGGGPCSTCRTAAGWHPAVDPDHIWWLMVGDATDRRSTGPRSIARLPGATTSARAG